jgi:hypothetical protein
MPHPHRRTWTLGTLDRDLVYRLVFDAEAFRWEVQAVCTVAEASEVVGWAGVPAAWLAQAGTRLPDASVGSAT